MLPGGDKFLSSGSLASIFMESSKIPINSRWVEGGNVLPGAMGISSSVNRVSSWQRAVEHCGRGGSTSNEKIIQYVQDPWDIELVADYPFQGIRERIEEKRGTS